MTNENDIPRDLDPHTFASFERLEAARAERERRAERALLCGAPHRVTFAAPRKRAAKAKRAPQSSPVTGALASAKRAVKSRNFAGALFALAAASVHAGDNRSAIRALQAALAA